MAANVDAMDRPLSEVEFFSFDTETTGLMPASERVVELSGIRATLDEEISRFEALVNPHRPIPAAATRVHGISDDDVSDKPDIGEILPAFAGVIDGSVGVAHNAEFDVSFLAHECARANQGLPRIPVIDTVEISRALRPDLPNHKLETIAASLGCPASTYHRALADSETLMNVLRGLIAGAPQLKTLADLFALTSGALTFGPDERLWVWLNPELGPLEEALVKSGRVTILYEPEGKRGEAREVTPRGWMRRPGATYLVAHCERDHTDRNFRLDWIKQAQYAQATLF